MTSASTTASRPSLSGFRFDGFGQKDNQQQQRESDPLLQRLHKIRDSYDPESTSYRFQAIVYNTKAGGSLSIGGPQIPKCVTKLDWQRAIASAPDRETRTPEVLSGFKGLEDRIKAQETVLGQMRTRLQDMQARISELSTTFGDLIIPRIRKMTENNNLINRQLMSVLKSEEVNALQGIPFTREEELLFEKLDSVRTEIERPNKYIAALNTLNVTAKFMRETLAVPPKVNVKPEVINRAAEILKSNGDAVKALIGVIKSSAKCVKAMEEALENTSF
jgi:hypothetical protein